MAESNELTFDVVMSFLIDKGGRITNHELVSHFRPLLNDPVNQVTNRLQFRDIVNNIATVREEQGVKYVCLKEKYFRSFNEGSESECGYESLELNSNYNSIHSEANTSKPQNYQPYWRYRLSSNASLVPPPPLLSFKFCSQEDSASLPTHLSSSSGRLFNDSFSDDSSSSYSDRSSSMNNCSKRKNENYYGPCNREDPVQLENSWIHEQGPRYQRYYSEPKDVDWSFQVNPNLCNGDRPRHNSIAVGMAAGSLLKSTDHEGSDKQVLKHSAQSDNGSSVYENYYKSPKDEEISLNNSRSTKIDSFSSVGNCDADAQNISDNNRLRENHQIENKENIQEASKITDICHEKENESTEDGLPNEYRPHSESVKERARRIDNMANEQPNSNKTPLPVHASSKTKSWRSEKVSDDNLSVASQLDSKLRRQWFVKAAQSDYHAMVALLKKEPRLAGIRDITSGFTALHWAAKHGNAEIVKLIAGTHKVNPDVKSHGGYTCLHIATLYKHKSIVDLLIRTYGANPTIRDNSGKRADQYPPDYVTYTAGMTRRPADPRTSITLPHNNKRIHVRPLEKDPPSTGTFFRIGSLNLKVSMTAPAFGGSRGRRIQRLKTWGSADSVTLPWSQGNGDKSAFLRKKKTKKKNSDPELQPHPTSANCKHDSDSDSAYGFHS